MQVRFGGEDYFRANFIHGHVWVCDRPQEDPEISIEEVKLTVPETDDPNIPALTFRTWSLGIILCAFLSFVNQFFFFRTAPITISAIAGQMASLYLGRFMAQVLPDKKILGIRINPGPFNIKVPTT